MSRQLPIALHADLLRALALAGADRALADRLALRLGFERRPDRSDVADAVDPTEPALRRTPPDPPHGPLPEPAAMSTPSSAEPLTAPMWAVTRIEPLPQPEPDPEPAEPALQTADCEPRMPGPPPDAPPLVPRAALWPALRRTASNSHPAGIDVPALVQALARGASLRRLPRRQRRSTAGQLWVLQDVAERLAPYQADFDAVVDDLLRLRGEQGMTLWTFRNLPDHTLERVTPQAATAWEGALPLPAPGLRLLVLSDLGALAQGPALEQAWARCVERWRRAGAELAVWSPLAAPQVPRGLADRVPVQCLSGRPGLRRQRGAWASQAQRQAEHARLHGLLRQLQVLASCAVELDPALLRDLRLLQPALAQEPALEALYWQSPDVEPSQVGRVLRPAVASQRRTELGGLPADLQAQVLATLLRHHAHAGQSTEATEVLLWRSHASPAAAASPSLATALEDSQRWWRGLVRRAGQADGWPARLRGYARDVLARQADDTRWQQHCGEQVATLMACAGDDDLPPLPHVPAHWVLQARGRRLGGTGAARPWALVQRGASVWAWPADQPLPKQASRMLGDVLALAAIVGQGEPARRVLPLGEEPVRLAGLDVDARLWTLWMGAQCLTLEPVLRPAWAQGWARDRHGLHAWAPSPWGTDIRLNWHAASPVATPGWRAPSSPAAGRHGARAQPLRLHLASAAADAHWAQRLQALLQPQIDRGWITLDDGFGTVSGVGAHTEATFRAHLATCSGAVLLISSVHLASRWFRHVELPSLLDRHRQGGFLLIGVLIDDADWLSVPGLGELPMVKAAQPLHKDRPYDADLLFTEVVQRLRRHVEGRWPSPSMGDRASLALAVVADDDFGLAADLRVGQATQRLRWLPPGEFWMGSPPDEPGRYDDEGPRHRVRLTAGFWLADTACTQALWLAVMGGQNPSRFTGDDQRPVEQVSWDDVQAFLGALQALLPPGCEAVLPTEAQWEYACRAGTDTAFNTGATLDRMLANFDAANDTPLAPRGEESKATVPVKSLPPNAWGLYEMHGNVWEWCADMWRPFGGITDPDEPVENPIGPQEQGPEAHRALRGGSWIGPAGGARSAFRLDFERGDRRVSLGFRFALRSTSPAGPEGPPVASGPEGRPGTSGPEGPPAVAAPRGAPPARPEAEPRGVFGQAARWLADQVKPRTQPKPKPGSGKPPRKP